MSKGKTTELDVLTDFEEEVYERIKEILSKNVVFQIDSELVDLCCQKVKTSELKVYTTIYSLLQRKFIVPGSTLTKADILTNENRALIYNQIKEMPGIHIRELCSFLGKSSGVVRAHLRVLENFEYIRRKSFTSPRLTLLFTKEYPDIYEDYFVLMKNENDQQIIQLLIKNHLLTVSELSKQMGVHHSTIQYHLEKLERLNFVINVKLDENTTKYAFNQSKLETLMKFLEEIVA